MAFIVKKSYIPILDLQQNITIPTLLSSAGSSQNYVFSTTDDIYFEAEIYLNSYDINNPILSSMNTEHDIINEFMFFIAGVDEVDGRGIPAGSFIVYNGERGSSLSCHYTDSAIISLNTWTKVTAKRTNGIWSLFINDIACSVSRFNDAGVPNDQFGNENLFVYIGRAEGDDVNLDGQIRNIFLSKKNKLSLIIKKNTTFKIPRTPFLPSSLGGLALWLKADAGITLGPAQYISSITLDSNDENGDPFPADGIYTRASGGTTTFTNSNGSYIVSIFGTTDWSIWGSDGDPEEPETRELYRIYLTEEGANAVQTITDVVVYDTPNPVPTYSTTSTAPIPNDESLVVAWADQSGNGHNCSSSNAVVLVSSPYPYIYFGGADTESEITLHPDVFNSFSALSLFAVWNIIDGSNQGILGSTTYSNFEIITADGSLVRMRNDNYDSSINTGGLWNDGEFVLSTIAADSAGDGSGTARKNGSTTGVDFDDANIEALQGGQTYKIGVYGGSHFTELSLAELVVYSDKLNGSQIDQVEAYLNSKYQIY